MKPKILLVYAALNHPLRANTKHLIECFREYGDADWFYLNLAHKKVPSYVARVAFDLIIFQTTFTQRLSRSDAYYAQMTRRARSLIDKRVPKVALVQDEFWNVGKVERFINAFGIDTVFSVAPESEWPILYPSVDRTRVNFHRVLTGYLDDATLGEMIAAGETIQSRPWDIVYRAAGKPNPAWGRFGYMKQRIVDAVSDLAPNLGLKVDISTKPEDTLFGRDWIEFLCGARYTIGVPSGASLLDRDGHITACVSDYQKAHPDASFEEIERHCFDGMDGNLKLSAIGPRHIEACATRTCQILVEGDYNGLLQPGVHYIPVARDLSDIRKVLSTLSDETRRSRIVERAFDDMVGRGSLTYRAFVAKVLSESLSGCGSLPGIQRTREEQRIQGWMMLVDRLEWIFARGFSGPIRRFRNLIGGHHA
jgi:hypothetical protein